MARPLRIEFAGAFYHVTSRGNERKPVFKSKRDRERFISYLASATERYGAVVHVYCLMDNHYHLFLETPRSNLSQIMHHINGAYTTYFNVKRDRSGHLFQGRYKAILVDADEYAVELSRYIHLNPVRAGIVPNPYEYKWSSCQYYTGTMKPPGWFEENLILGYFGKKRKSACKRYRDFVFSVIDKEYKNPLSELTQSIFLGGQDFISEIKAKYLRNKKEDRDIPHLRALSKKPEIAEIEKAIDSVFETDSRMNRQMKLYACHRFSGKKLKEIGRHYNISESGVTHASRRIKMAAKKDATLKRNIKLIERELNLSNV
jgi:REP element-mobilizing transposase RayT